MNPRLLVMLLAGLCLLLGSCQTRKKSHADDQENPRLGDARPSTLVLWEGTNSQQLPFNSTQMASLTPLLRQLSMGEISQLSSVGLQIVDFDSTQTLFSVASSEPSPLPPLCARKSETLAPQ